MEQRYRLKPKQWEALVNANKRLTELRDAFQREQERSALETALIYEAFDLDPDVQGRIDDATRELVVELPDAPPAPPAP